jgi:endonuclease YncB( thermonuclease family)
MVQGVAIASFVALAMLATTARSAELVVGRASVIDGDTLEIHGQRVRLYGIDAPESGQGCTDARGASYRCGQKAAEVLDYRISDGVVTCEPKDRDRYRRVVALCRVYGEDLGAWMVGLGWALAFRKSSTRYVAAEELASRRKAGIWAGRFTTPWQWRVEHSGPDPSDIITPPPNRRTR